MSYRTRKGKEFKRLVEDWCEALPPAPVGTRIRAELVGRGVALAMKVREVEADIVAGRAIETGTYQKLVATLIGIQRTLGLLPHDGGKMSPQSKSKAKPGPKPSSVSAHAKAVLKATGGDT